MAHLEKINTSISQFSQSHLHALMQDKGKRHSKCDCCGFKTARPESINADLEDFGSFGTKSPLISMAIFSSFLLDISFDCIEFVLSSLIKYLAQPIFA